MNRKPPVAAKKPHLLEIHGHRRTDHYHWLNQRDDPEVLAYLEAENRYTELVMRDAKKLERTLFDEIKDRIRQSDSTAPYFREGFFYYTRWEEDREYPIYCRKKGSLDAPEQVMLDVNEAAGEHDYFSVEGRAVSPDQRILAWAADTVGRRICTIRFLDLEGGESPGEEIVAATGNMAWAADSRTLFYSIQDPETLRSWRIHRHTLGTGPEDDELVYEEADETFSTYVHKSKSRDYIFISSQHTLSTEYRFLPADNPGGEFTLLLPREPDHEYHVDHLGESFFVLTNRNAPNYRLMETPVRQPAEEHWRELIAHRGDVLLENFELFEDHIVLEERKDGLVHLRIVPRRPQSGEDHCIDFGEQAWVAWTGINIDPASRVLRYGYSSMSTPSSVFEYDMLSHRKKLLKQEEVLGDFDPARYRTERLRARAADGALVPVSLVYRRDLRADGGNPLLLYGYGAYGHSSDPSFGSARLSLLDRGFICAIAHVRGGEELGRRWYDQGRMLSKRNTFTDFIACAEHLIDNGYTAADRLFAFGRSAGGLLIGAVANMAPGLFRGLVTEVPFVDIVTTMLDTSIPLTTGEFDEWGDPRDEELYRCMLSYSPYDNIGHEEYPAMLVTTSLHDSQVQYWEPAKWVARLREHNTGDNPILLKTNMSAGHSGPSGRFEGYREVAFNYAFILDVLGKES